MGITQREHDLLVGLFKQYVDSQVSELRGDVGEWAETVEQRFGQVAQRLDHPALVVDYRTWLIDTALAVGITPAEYIKRRKEIETAVAQMNEGLEVAGIDGPGTADDEGAGDDESA